GPGLLGRLRDASGGDRDAGLGEDGLGLAFDELHLVVDLLMVASCDPAEIIPQWATKGNRVRRRAAPARAGPDSVAGPVAGSVLHTVVLFASYPCRHAPLSISLRRPAGMKPGLREAGFLKSRFP